MRYLVCLCALILIQTSSYAQEKVERVASYGVFGLGGVNLHSANFQTLPGVPGCCPRYENGTGLGLAFGAFYSRPIIGAFAAEVRLGYRSLNAQLSRDEQTVVALDGIAVPATFRHTVAAKISEIVLEPHIAYDLFGALSLTAGLSLGYVINNTYAQEEDLVSPSDRGTFETGKRTRNQFTGVTPSHEIFNSNLALGVQYQLAASASHTVFLRPELTYLVGLTPIAKGMSWYANSLLGGMSLVYSPIPAPAPPPPIAEILAPKPVAPIKKMPALEADLSATSKGADNVEKPLKFITIEDYIRTQYRPLLNYVFFDQGSSQLPTRYHLLSPDETHSFTVNRSGDIETLPLYYDMLNIVGKRMQEHPQATLTIIGCNDNLGVETANKKLSHTRADLIRNYFATVWNLGPERLRMEVRNLPEQPSVVTDSDGSQENRRVEIHSDDWRILEPIFSIDTIHVPNPPIVRFHPTAIAEAGLDRWQIGTVQTNGKLRDFSGTDTLPDVLKWDLEKEHNSVLETLDTVSATLRANDRTGQSAESQEVTLPVRHYTLADKHRDGSIDTIISRYSLILFDFNRAELSPANQRIADFVKARVSNNAQVNILGYTDRMGSDDYNRQLSTQRATSVKNVLGIQNGTANGLGRSVVLYDNNLPEGRFYSRTVTVVISTPTKH